LIEYFHFYSDARDALIEYLNQEAPRQLKILLEIKHLYQKVTIDADTIIKEILIRLERSSDEREFQKQSNDCLTQTIEDRFFLIVHPVQFVAKHGAVVPTVQLLLPSVKVFCDECKSSEAFNPLWFVDVANELAKPHPTRFGQCFPSTYQLFLLVYQCQRCKSVPIAFQVRRDKWKLILEGRSPIEHIEMPSYIPKAEQKYFRDALVAMHGGKTLAALFYLRLFLEQFARRQTGIATREFGEEIMKAYGAGLPDKIRDTMPSLREWYEKLSAAIHAAREDAELFEEAKSEIDRHFDMRRVHKIHEKSLTSE
jgi:hypothetical protein